MISLGCFLYMYIGIKFYFICLDRVEIYICVDDFYLFMFRFNIGNVSLI